MNINQDLQLVIDANENARFVATPLSTFAFKKYYLLLAKAYSEMMSEGIVSVLAPRVIVNFLCDMDKKKAEELLAELKRLTVVEGTGDVMQVDDAIKAGIIAEEDYEEAEGYIAFFSCLWHNERRKIRHSILVSLSQAWGCSTKSSGSTETPTASVATPTTSTPVDNSTTETLSALS